MKNNNTGAFLKVLIMVSFDEQLFRKEFKNTLGCISKEEYPQAKDWMIQNRFNVKYPDLIILTKTGLEVKDNFLAENEENRKSFELFEIEKFNNEFVYIINIYSIFSNKIEIEVCNQNKVLNLQCQRNVNEYDSSKHDLVETYQFTLPDFIETMGYYYEKKGNKIFLIFNKIRYGK